MKVPQQLMESYYSKRGRQLPTKPEPKPVKVTKPKHKPARPRLHQPSDNYLPKSDIFTAKCKICKVTGPADKFVFGVTNDKPFQPLDHYCRKCAKKHGIEDYMVIRPRGDK